MVKLIDKPKKRIIHRDTISTNGEKCFNCGSINTYWIRLDGVIEGIVCKDCKHGHYSLKLRPFIKDVLKDESKFVS